MPTKRFCQTVPTLMATTEKIDAETVAGCDAVGGNRQLWPKDHGDADEADGKPGPMARLDCLAKSQPRNQRRDQGLQPDNQCRHACGQSIVDGPEDGAEIDAVDEATRNDRMHGAALVRPVIAGKDNPDAKDCARNEKPRRQETGTAPYRAWHNARQ